MHADDLVVFCLHNIYLDVAFCTHNKHAHNYGNRLSTLSTISTKCIFDPSVDPEEQGNGYLG